MNLEIFLITHVLEWITFYLHFYRLFSSLGGNFKVISRTNCICIPPSTQSHWQIKNYQMVPYFVRNLNGIKKTSKCLCNCTWDWLVNTSEAQMGCRYQFIPPAEWLQMSLCWKGWANAPLAVVLFKWVQCTPVGKFPLLLPFWGSVLPIGFHSYTCR